MFSQDEILALIFSTIIAGMQWIKFAQQCATWPYRMLPGPRVVMLGSLALAATLLFYTLVACSAHDVRGSNFYIAFYFIIGVAWLGLGRRLLDYLDLCVRDDVLDRGNMASAFACGGALLGLMACFAGGNVGEGPGWWVVIYSAALATAAAALAWVVLDMATRLADTISIERDIAAGLRAGGFWIGLGLILGRAVAGNWVSLADTNHDFIAFAWPVLPLLAVALIVEFITRPGTILAHLPLSMRGALPAAIYAGAGVVSLVQFGAP